MAFAFVAVAKGASVAGLLTAGVLGTIIAVGIPSTPAGPGAWIDAPAAGIVVAPGQLNVLAHASEDSGAPAADLLVDGKHVATATATTSADGTLSLFDFAWTATPGEHKISIRTSTGVDSRYRTVFVSGQVTHAPTPTPTPSASPTPTPVATVPPAPAPPAPPPPPAPAPHVGVPLADGHVSWCGGSTTISVAASDATSVTIAVTPGGPNLVAVNSASTWSAQIRSGLLPDSDFDAQESYTLTATATGPGGSVQSTSGTLTMENCKP